MTINLVLSRKGFDSANGAIPSPILPDGRMVSLPIPSRTDDYSLADLDVTDIDVTQLVSDLGGPGDARVHLDPDLQRPAARRMPGWRPALGQTGAAQSHLAAEGIGTGDAFLFFGWFRQVEFVQGRWRYQRVAPHVHALFGWLEVDAVLSIVTARKQCLADHAWIADHPHVAKPEHYDNQRNTLYVAPERSQHDSALRGGGRFETYAPELRLTTPGATRSLWTLPAWFHPGANRLALTYHKDPKRWKTTEHGCELRSVAIGQEFVLHGKHYPELSSWVGGLIRAHAAPQARV